MVRIICLVLLALLLPGPLVCFAESAASPAGGAAPSSSGAEIQDRLTKGSEAEQQQQARASAPEVVAAVKQLEATLLNTYGVPGPDNSVNPWRDLIADAKAREFMAPDLSAAQLAGALRAIDRLLSTRRWQHEVTDVQRLALAEQLMSQVARFPEPKESDTNRNDVLAIVQTLLFKYPAVVADGVTDLLIHGNHQFGQSDVIPSDYAETLMYEWAIGVLPSGDGRVDTPQLQQIYERLSGTTKGEFVLKNQSPFVLSEPDGSHKLFANDTEFLKWWHLVNGSSPLLRSVDTSKGYQGHFEYSPGVTSSPDLKNATISEDSVIFENKVCQLIRIRNNNPKSTVSFTYAEAIEHPFADMFEVRGWKRKAHGEQLTPVIDVRDGHLRLSYQGLDGAIMSTDVVVSGTKPDTIKDNQLSWSVSLAPGQTFETTIGIGFTHGDAPAAAAFKTFDQMTRLADADYAQWRARQATVITDDAQFNKLIDQAFRDIYILREQTPRGPAIAAGLPWFACAFGRDDAITALQTLPFIPELSGDVLRTLSAYQGTRDNPETAEKPGKIMHELRVGEMARNHEIPFAPYYGTVDATPLWLLLLGRYVEQTGDLQLARQLRPQMDRALEYLDAEVLRGHGYLTYGGAGKEALSNQGWKDSGDSVFYSDGKLAQAPIAICEVQGYLYEGWRLAARVLRAGGDDARAAKVEAGAAALQQRFQRDFWMPKRNFAAEALDGHGRQVDIITSNPGQLLMTGLLTPEHAGAVARHLMQKDMFSGFGIRTLARGEPRYFSNSYHDGSIWPHDNSLIACGLHDYLPRAAASVMWSLFKAAEHQSDLRLPELFGGYTRESFPAPIPYPVSCSPQAWAAGSMLLMLFACSGVHLDGSGNCVMLDVAAFPHDLSKINISGLHVGANQIDMRFTRVGDAWTSEVTSNPGHIAVKRNSGTNR